MEKDKEKDPIVISKRDFLKGLAAGAVATAAAGAGVATLAWPKAPTVIGRLRVYPELCAGCRRCELICSMVHEDSFNPRYARISTRQDFASGLITIAVCRQCIEPPCIPACPAGAISRDEKTGAVVVDGEKCIGVTCTECIKACPYNGVWFHPATGKAMTCDLCGGEPKCVEECPREALEFGRVMI